MKKIFSILALAVGTVVLTSCSDFLDQKSESELDSQAAYNSTYYTSLRINKIYGALTQDATYSQYLPIIWCLNTDTELVDGLGDDASNTGSERGNMNYNMVPGWNRLPSVWTALYGIIEDCNLTIEGIESSSLLSGSSAAEMRKYEGEALTLRAMVYLDLIRFFGDIPFKSIATKDDLSNAYIGKTDRDEIMDQLIKDLEIAVEYLPWASASFTTEHVNKGYAHALLAQIALTRAGYAIREKAKDGYVTDALYSYDVVSDATYPTQRPDDAKRKEMYQLALKHLNTLIAEGPHKLNPSFKDEWKQLNMLRLDQTYFENIFEVPMGLNVGSELGYTVGVRMNGVTSRFGYGNSSGKMKTTAPHMYSYHAGDIRRNVTCSNIQFVEGKVKGKKTTVCEMIGNAPFGIYIGKWDPRMMSDSWLAENKAMSAKHFSGINCVKMRMPQVYLMYAECINELYSDPDHAESCGMTARQALAEVHNRAFNDATAAQQAAEATYLNSLTGGQNFFEAIVDENAWELTGEGFRKYDLIRWNILVKKIKDMKQTYVTAIKNGTYPKTINFNYIDKTTQADIDEDNINWQTGGTAGDGSVSGFGGSKLEYTEESKKDKQVYTNLQSISNGLIGTTTVNQDGTINYTDPTILNRYIMPIGSTVISASNGTLYNSYGYGN